MPRSSTAIAWQPRLPLWPPSTGRNIASTTTLSMVSLNTPTTAADTNTVSRLICSQGWRNLKLRISGVARRSSRSTPTMAPAWAEISKACCSNSTWPRTWPTRRAVFLANRVHREMPGDDFAHRLDQGHLRAQEERRAQHHLVQRLRALGVQQFAERGDAEQAVVRVNDEQVGDHAIADRFAQHVDRGGDAGAAAEHRRRVLEQAPDRAFRITLGIAPVGAGRGGIHDARARVLGHRRQDGVGACRRQATPAGARLRPDRARPGARSRSACRGRRPCSAGLGRRGSRGLAIRRSRWVG